MDKDTKQALEIIKRGSDEIIPEDSFKKLLTSKKKLTVKAGFDPTSADLAFRAYGTYKQTQSISGFGTYGNIFNRRFYWLNW